MSEEKYRFLIQEEEVWKIKIFSRSEAQNWILGNPKAILIRFAVVGDGCNMPFDTKEEAFFEAKEHGGKVSIIKPKDSVYEGLPPEAISLMYASL